MCRRWRMLNPESQYKGAWQELKVTVSVSGRQRLTFLSISLLVCLCSELVIMPADTSMTDGIAK